MVMGSKYYIFLQTCQIQTPEGYGCFCNDGFFLSGQKCVEKLACGCVETLHDDARFYREVRISKSIFGVN